MQGTAVLVLIIILPALPNVLQNRYSKCSCGALDFTGSFRNGRKKIIQLEPFYLFTLNSFTIYKYSSQKHTFISKRHIQVYQYQNIKVYSCSFRFLKCLSKIHQLELLSLNKSSVWSLIPDLDMPRHNYTLQKNVNRTPASAVTITSQKRININTLTNFIATYSFVQRFFPKKQNRQRVTNCN